jgi:ABC-type multidrug transport system fused ATPase/permease subunit
MKLLRQYEQLLAIITPPRNTLLLLVSLMLCENALALIFPWLAGQFTRSLLEQSFTHLPLSYRQILLLWLVLLFAQVLLSFYSQSLSGTTTEKMLIQLRARLYDHLQSLPMSFFHNSKHGETLALLTSDAAILSSFITGNVVALLPILLTAVLSLVCIFLINPVIALLAGLLVPVFYLTTKILGRNIRPIARQYMNQYAETFAVAEENLATLPIIKSFTRESLESRRFQNSNRALFNLSSKYIQAQARLAPVIKFFSTAIILIILWIVGDDIAKGQLPTSDIVSLMLYGMLLTQPISRLADTYGQMQRALGAAERLLSVFATRAEDHRQGIPLPPVQGEVRFSGVSFAYPGRETLFQNLDLVISAGETVAITGVNGAGKSTIAHLLMRFATPSQGAIFIDGHNIADVTLDSLRAQIGLVQQQVLLQNSTVLENVLFGRPDADRQSLIKAVKAAHALPFIEKLPQGFDTLIGDQGVKLSGGQKQRLSLARAFLKDPAILILDEATAMFDPEGEENFIADNKELLGKRTVILITHRPASLALADRILHLENGSLTAIEAIR